MIKETTNLNAEPMPAFDAYLLQLKDLNDIVYTMSQHVKLTKLGDHYVCACPAHSDNANTCRVSPDTQGFYSEGCCGAGGDIFNFISLMNNISYMEAVVLLAKKTGIPMPQDESIEGES